MVSISNAVLAEELNVKKVQFCFSTRVARWHIFNPKILVWITFGGPKNGKGWYIIWPFGIYYGNLVDFMAVW
jgi:hypothetical protein